MDNRDDKIIHDVDYEDIENKKTIRGKVLYYSTSQVAQMLDIADSKVRYYSTMFDEILHIEVSNKQRRYTHEDIEKLKFLIELKNEGMTIRQIQEYTQNVDFNTENGVQVKESNPLSIQTLAKALMEEQQKQMVEFKKDIMQAIMVQLQDQMETIKTNNENIKDEILENVAITVDEITTQKFDSMQKNVLEGMESHLEQTQTAINDNITNIGNTIKDRDIDLVNRLKQIQEQKQKEIELRQQEANNKKSFWHKLIGK
jgi:DNA-binding transcriptional MerR regulator